MSNKWKDAGFTQRRPKDPGVYYIKNDIKRLHPSLREVEGWDIVELRFPLVAGAMNRKTGKTWPIGVFRP